MAPRLVVALLLAAGPVRAEENGAIAKRHFEEATKAFRLGEFPRAVEEYRAAYNAKPEPSILYNIAQAYRLAGNLQQAVFFYRSYLHTLPNAENRAEVTERIAAIDEQLKAEKAVTTKPPNTLAPVPPIETQPIPPPGANEKPASAPPAAVVEEAPRRPLVKRWWLWTTVGVAAAGIALGVGLGVGLSGPADAPASGLGAAKVFY
jgi:tetratricopeptide (TPR) repeat protein